MAVTYEFTDNGNSIKMVKNVNGKVSTTKFNKRNTSVTFGGNPMLFEISDLRGSACPKYTEVTVPTSTDVEDLCDQVQAWLDDVQVSVTVPPPVGAATEAKQDVQITNQGAAGTASPFGSGMLGWLRGIWDRLNQFTFTGGDLNVNASISLGGANAAVTTVALTAASAIVVAADSDRKQLVIYNDTNKEVWVFYGTPAVYGTGILLVKKQTIVEDVYTGQVTAILDTGETGDLQVTDVTV